MADLALSSSAFVDLGEFTLTDPSIARMAETVQPVSATARDQAAARLESLAKPPKSLGALESTVVTLAGIQNRAQPIADGAALWLFAGDHGLVNEGVSAWPQTVTGAMLGTFVAGRAAINQICTANNIAFTAVDAGVANVPPGAGYIDRSMGYGTRSSLYGPAMDREAAVAAIGRGYRLLRDEGGDAELVGFGEMGIGNTAAASLITHALTGMPLETCIGRGAGLDDEGLARKRELLEQVVARHGRPEGPVAMLSAFGGFEIAMLAGAAIGAAANGQAVLVDGFIATAGVALACELVPGVRDYCLFCHESAEPGHRQLLDHLAARPLLRLDMALGEGTGAAMAVPLIRSAVACHAGMDTVEEALARFEGNGSRTAG